MTADHDAIRARLDAATPETYAEVVAADPLGIPRHDHGCTCWPHVAEDDAKAAIQSIALDEYRDCNRSRADLLAENERLRADFVRQRDCDHSDCIDRQDAAKAEAEAMAQRARAVAAEADAAALYEAAKGVGHGPKCDWSRYSGQMAPTQWWAFIERWTEEGRPCQCGVKDALAAHEKREAK